MRDFSAIEPAVLQRRWRLLRVNASRDIDAAPDDVWAALADHRTWSTWHDDYDAHEPIGDRAEGLGARFRTKEWVLETESEVTVWRPGHAIGLTVVRAAGWHWLLRSYRTEISIDPVQGSADRSTVTYRVDFTGTVLFWLLAAYTVAYGLGSIYWSAAVSLKNLERLLHGGSDAALPDQR